MTQELDIASLEVIGEVPQDLNGAYFRNGPNRKFAAEGRYHWYDGDGMIHAAYFDKGRVRYKNRWIQTEPLKEELQAGRALWKGLREPPRRDRPDMPLKNTSNTDVTFHNGKLVTTWYLSGDMYHIDPFTLETLGTATSRVRRTCMPRRIPRWMSVPVSCCSSTTASKRPTCTTV